MKTCDKCNGTGKIPEWPRPYIPLTAHIIDSIKRNAPTCDKCGGKGYVEEDER